MPMLGVNNNIFGTAGLTSVGGFGFNDSTAPFNSLTNWSTFLTVNAITRQPVVEGDKVAMGNVMICNFAVDNRYIDLENCSKLSSVFRKVFE
jgi:pyruvate/2-oxoglutarate dehydrogenase complex dihydrolipoamide acyltransferase (E2) component